MTCHYIIFQSYHGIGWDGNNSNKILEKLDYLEQAVIEEIPIYQHLILAVINLLRAFKSVKDAAFGKDLKPEFETTINNFADTFKSLQNDIHNTNIEGLILSTTWKIHIIVSHIVPFVKHYNLGLGNFAEQAGEAVHAKIKPTCKRYKVSIEHIKHGEEFKKAVVDFNTRRV